MPLAAWMILAFPAAFALLFHFIVVDPDRFPIVLTGGGFLGLVFFTLFGFWNEVNDALNETDDPFTQRAKRFVARRKVRRAGRKHR